MFERVPGNLALFIISAAPPEAVITHATLGHASLKLLHWTPSSTVYRDSGDVRGNVFRGFPCPVKSPALSLSFPTTALSCLINVSSFSPVISSLEQVPSWRRHEGYNKMTTERMNLITSTTSPLTPRKQSYFTLHVRPLSTQSHERFSLVPYNSAQIASLLFPTVITDCKSEYVSCSIPRSVVFDTLDAAATRYIIRQNLDLHKFLSSSTRCPPLLIEIVSNPIHSFNFII